MEMTDLDKLIEAVEASSTEINWKAIAGYSSAKWGYCERAFDGSLDAAKALHEALLPNMGAVVNTHINFATVSEIDEYGLTLLETLVGAESETPARAWLIAILKAYRTQL